MSINLEINPGQLNDEKVSGRKLHFMPMKIDGEGPADVQAYFDPYTVNEDGVLRNTFRGFPLVGCDFPVASSYRGIVFRESGAPLDENSNRVFRVDGTFDRLTYWNYDKIPSKADAFRQIWDCVNIADSMCAEISMEDIEKRMQGKKEASSDGCEAEAKKVTE